jgi:radical SAM superfamily enzyme YgiQ (UPF0313 family)
MSKLVHYFEYHYFESKDDINYIKHNDSWVTKNKVLKQFIPSPTMVPNLDSIPPYDLNMLKYPNDYLNTNDDLFALGTGRHEKDIYMFATRGCPYHCIFCASQFVHGHKVRSYSAKRIKSDIMHYNVKYGMTSFPFLDDHFLADKQKALDILDFIHSWGFACRIFNLNYIHLDRDIIQALKKTGSDRILITLDGLDEGFLRKVVKKPANFKKAREVIQICREEKIIVLANILVGYPGETVEDLKYGALNMLKMGANWYSILIASPLQGSELYGICKEKGYLAKTDEFQSMDYYTPAIHTPDFTPEWIKRKAYEINLNLNFVHNWDMQHGEFNIPLVLFERVMEIAPSHAFAYYFAAICSKNLGNTYTWERYRDMYYNIKRSALEWKEWSEWFKLREI